MKKSLRLASVALALVMITSVMLSGTFAKYTSEFAGQDTALVARWNFAGTTGMVEGNTPNAKTLDIFTHAYDEYMTQTGTDKNGDTSYILAPGVDGQFNIEFSYSGDVDTAITLALKSTYTQNVPLQFSLDSQFSSYTYNLNDLAQEILENLYYANGTAKPTTPVTEWTKITSDVITANSQETNKVFLGSADISPARINANGLVKAPENTVVITKTDAAEHVTYVSIPVYWRWAYNVGLHNTAKLAAAGFTGTGTGGAWTDADDTAIGKASQGANRLEYKIDANIIATQVVPAKD